jgi:nucleolar pre-ribosomal-associated protein 1
MSSRYWSSAALTLEPRLSSKWIANIAFFGALITLPIPSSSFLISESTATNRSYLPSPPPLSTILENILPSVNTKSHFSKGLQSTSGLVQHCTALALAKCLRKYDEVMKAFEELGKALEEDENDGQWYSRRREVGREVRRRVPEFQVVVAFSQLKATTGPNIQSNASKAELLAESAQRLLWLYHQCLPEVVSEARFDVGKLLTNFGDEKDGEEIDEGLGGGLHTVRQLHILRLLKESDQFSWSGKMGKPLYTWLCRTFTDKSSQHPLIALTCTHFLKLTQLP